MLGQQVEQQRTIEVHSLPMQEHLLVPSNDRHDKNEKNEKV